MGQRFTLGDLTGRHVDGEVERAPSSQLHHGSQQARAARVCVNPAFDQVLTTVRQLDRARYSRRPIALTLWKKGQPKIQEVISVLCYLKVFSYCQDGSVSPFLRLPPDFTIDCGRKD